MQPLDDGLCVSSEFWPASQNAEHYKSGVGVRQALFCQSNLRCPDMSLACGSGAVLHVQRRAPSGQREPPASQVAERDELQLRGTQLLGMLQHPLLGHCGPVRHNALQQQ